MEAPDLPNNKFGAPRITMSVSETAIICIRVLPGNEFSDTTEATPRLSEISKNEPNILKITSHNGLAASAKPKDFKIDNFLVKQDQDLNMFS